MSFIIGIAGGSGAGKSTLADNTKKENPADVTILRFDDYGERKLAPKFKHRINWDHPDAFDFPRLKRDLVALSNGKSIKVHSRGNHHKTGKTHRKWVTVHPRKLILLEGFLVLSRKEIRDFLDVKIYLDAPFEVLLGRRPEPTTKFYSEQILEPMFKKYVAPTKKYAEAIDVTKLDKSEMKLCLGARKIGHNQVVHQVAKTGRMTLAVTV